MDANLFDDLVYRTHAVHDRKRIEVFEFVKMCYNSSASNGKADFVFYYTDSTVLSHNLIHCAHLAPFQLIRLPLEAVESLEGRNVFKVLSMGKFNQKFKPNRTCKVCGKAFYARPCRVAKGQGNYCSNQCAGVEKRGELNGRWSGGDVTKICSICGLEFQVPARKQDKTRFCSVVCSSSWKEQSYSGTNNPRWTGGEVSIICEVCGKEFSVERNQATYARCCSRACSGEWKSIHKSGENNSNWHGGKSFEPYPATFNKAFKQAIRERDGHLCICGKTGKEVHHINYVKNDTNPQNCITLCRSCHAKTNFRRDYWQSFFERLKRQQ